MSQNRLKSDFELMAEGNRGNQAAVGELFERHYVSSVGLARIILRSGEESGDTVQMAYLSAFRNLDAFRGESSFKTWITRIVFNNCLMQLRASRRRVNWVQLKDLETGPEQSRLVSRRPSPEESAWAREIGSACSGAVAKLPGNQREAFNLHAASGLSIREVATVLGLTEPAAKARIFRARTRLQSSLRRVRFSRRNPKTKTLFNPGHANQSV